MSAGGMNTNIEGWLCDSVSCVSLSYPRTATPCRRTRRPSSCARSNPATAPLTSTPGRRQRGPRSRRQRGRRRRRRRRRRGGLRRRKSCVEQFRDTIESVCIFLERLRGNKAQKCNHAENQIIARQADNSFHYLQTAK